MKRSAKICLASVFIFLSCDHVDNQSKPSVRLILQNQTDHSGITLKVAGLDTIFVSDAEGVIDLSVLSVGQYNIRIRYPFFKELDTTLVKEDGVDYIDFQDTLDQLVQFWVVPEDTSVSRTAQGVVYGLATNISDNAVFYTSAVQGINRAIIPTDTAWPNADCVRCEQMQPSVQGSPSELYIAPGDTVFAGQLSFQLGLCHYTCYTPSTYEAFIGFVDRSTFSDYYRAHITTDSLHSLWFELNASLLRKRELFRPATIRFID